MREYTIFKNPRRTREPVWVAHGVYDNTNPIFIAIEQEIREG